MKKNNLIFLFFVLFSASFIVSNGRHSHVRFGRRTEAEREALRAKLIPGYAKMTPEQKKAAVEKFRAERRERRRSRSRSREKRHHRCPGGHCPRFARHRYRGMTTPVTTPRPAVTTPPSVPSKISLTPSAPSQEQLVTPTPAKTTVATPSSVSTVSQPKPVVPPPAYTPSQQPISPPPAYEPPQEVQIEGQPETPPPAYSESGPQEI